MYSKIYTPLKVSSDFESLTTNPDRQFGSVHLLTPVNIKIHYFRNVILSPLSRKSISVLIGSKNIGMKDEPITNAHYCFKG